MEVDVDVDTPRSTNIEGANGRVRLVRIDGLEMGTPEGPVAKRALLAMLTGAVSCEQVDTDPRMAGYQQHDQYSRIVSY